MGKEMNDEVNDEMNEKMNKLETLYEFAYDTGTTIVSRTFSNTKRAACMYIKPVKLIVLDVPAIKSWAEEMVLLAEEVGHYETGGLYMIETTHNLPIARSNRIKCEGLAMRWAYSYCLPPEEIERGVAYGLDDDWQVAEYCQVTVDFLHRAIEYHRSCGVVFSFDRSE